MITGAFDAILLRNFGEDAFLPEESLLALLQGDLGVCWGHYSPKARRLKEVDPGMQDVKCRLGERELRAYRKGLPRWQGEH